jgi:hypothetical protein
LRAQDIASSVDEPDPTIVNAAGKSLKSIIEGAIGGAMGNTIGNPDVWTRLGEAMTLDQHCSRFSAWTFENFGFLYTQNECIVDGKYRACPALSRSAFKASY